MVYIGTNRKQLRDRTKRMIRADVDQAKLIEKELDLIRSWILERSLHYGLLDNHFNPDPSSPKTWQTFSTYLAGIPEGLVLSEENILDLIGYLVLLLGASRERDLFSHFNQVVTTKSGDKYGSGKLAPKKVLKAKVKAKRNVGKTKLVKGSR